MQLNFNELKYLIGTPETIEKMRELRPLRPFDGRVLSFFDSLSVKLRKNRDFSDAATFGFWCRKAALLQQKESYDDISERLGRGIVFHSTPSNVPVNFAFSLAAGLLAGNANIVRLPAKDFEQVEIITSAVKELLSSEYTDIAPYICFVKYASNSSINDAFSSLCDVRVIWGGDATIARMRRSPLGARAKEITFADRFSALVINADAYLEQENKNTVIQGFYNDTYYSDQNACTSPRIVFWTGSAKEEAKRDFWQRVHDMAKERYTLAPVQSVGKLAAMYRAAAENDISVEKSEDMLVMRLVPAKLDGALMEYKYNSGFFFEKDIDELEEMIPVCTNRCQTLTYFGIEKQALSELIENSRPCGIDRIVPIGKSMDFSLKWDGYDLIREMSRLIEIYSKRIK